MKIVQQHHSNFSHVYSSSPLWYLTARCSWCESSSKTEGTHSARTSSNNRIRRILLSLVLTVAGRESFRTAHALCLLRVSTRTSLTRSCANMSSITRVSPCSSHLNIEPPNHASTLTLRHRLYRLPTPHLNEPRPRDPHLHLRWRAGAGCRIRIKRPGLGYASALASAGRRSVSTERGSSLVRNTLIGGYCAAFEGKLVLFLRMQAN